MTNINIQNMKVQWPMVSSTSTVSIDNVFNQEKMRQLYRNTHLNTFKWVLRNYTDEIAHLKMDNPNMTAGCLKYTEILNPCIRTEIF